MILSFAEKIYTHFAESYHRKWDKRGGWRASVPVISVGNLTVGGNGKTPFVIELVKLLSERFENFNEPNRIAVLSRGYGRKSNRLHVVEADDSVASSGDEPILIKRNCPNSLVISHANRIESARVAIEVYDARLIILDDGFQHRPLARDIDLVLLDSEKPLDNGHLLPAGRLRERPDSLKRATFFVSVGAGKSVESLARKFGKPLGHVTAVALREAWSDRPIKKTFLLTGVARPDRVRSFLENAGIEVIGHQAFRDHHVFTPSELVSVVKSANRVGATVVLTTDKDRIRIPSWDGEIPLVTIPYQLEILQPEILLELITQKVKF